MFGKVVNGKFIAPPVNDGNKTNVYKDPVWLEEHGFHELTQEEIKSIQPPDREPIKFSKLSIVRILGDTWTEWEQRLVEAGVKSYWDNCTYLSMDDSDFMTFWKQLASGERKILLDYCRY